MVHTGKPSTGCFACRRRKVKCDEAHPACQRCLKRRQPCPGYRDTIAIMFQDQNSWAKAKVRTRIGLASSPDGEPSPRNNRETVTRMARGPYIDPSVFAIDRFYRDYVVAAGILPFLDFLPDMFERSKDIACFRQALSAVALGSAAKQMRHHDMLLESKKAYGGSLESIANALQVPDLAKSDEVLVAVFLMGLYEVITADTLLNGTRDSHYQGRLALLRLRGKEQLDTKVGRSLFVIIHNQILIDSFVGCLTPPEDFLQSVLPLGDCNTVLEFGMSMYRVARFYATLSRLVRLSTQTPTLEQRAQLIAAIGQGVALDDHLTTSMESLPVDWLTCQAHPWMKPWTGPDSGLDDANDCIKDTAYEGLLALCVSYDRRNYTVMTQLATWNQYRAVRIHLLHALVAAAALIHPSPSSLDILALRAYWRSTLVALASGICETISTILGNLDEYGKQHTPWMCGRALQGYSLLWPLRTVVSVGDLPCEKKLCVKRALEYIGGTLGIGQASAMAKATHWMDGPQRIREVKPGESELGGALGVEEVNNLGKQY